jgi:alkanesulfonate monooxygenase SsuD/methylene tetrahydromethanopterin reductase-like flavin-dependent oxidoreductase (luciferase family)
MLSEDLAQLREDFPEWRFGAVWASAATGPDARRLWARHAEILLSAWNAADLRAAINAEQNRNGNDSGAS